MKLQLLIFIFTFALLTASAQKQPYFLFAYGQKTLNMVCGEKLLIKQDEVLLMPVETFTYRNQMLTESKNQYGTGYQNIYVEIIPASKAVICYEGERIYKQQSDGWNCTNTFYGCVQAGDMPAAEKSFAALQAESKNVTYKEIRRWGKAANLSPRQVEEKDLAIKWIPTKDGYATALTNTRKDVALQVTITGYKRRKGDNSQTDISKMIKTGESKIVVQPGGRSTYSIPAGDGFDVEIKETPFTEEEPGLIKKGKALFKQYLTVPGKGNELRQSSAGVRG